MAATAQLESLVSRLEQVTSRLEKVSVKGGGQGAAPGKYLVKKQVKSQNILFVLFDKKLRVTASSFHGPKRTDALKRLFDAQPKFVMLPCGQIK